MYCDFLRNADLAEELVLEQSGNYSGDLLKKSLEIAEETGCQEVIGRKGPEPLLAYLLISQARVL